MDFFFNDTATTEIYTLSLHDALPILGRRAARLGVNAEEFAEQLLRVLRVVRRVAAGAAVADSGVEEARSEEHTSELPSRQSLVFRLLLVKKKKTESPRKVR